LHHAKLAHPPEAGKKNWPQWDAEGQKRHKFQPVISVILVTLVIFTILTEMTEMTKVTGPVFRPCGSLPAE
jgi:hypothetical protein